MARRSRTPGVSRNADRRNTALFKKIEAWYKVRLRQHRYQHVFRGEVRMHVTPPKAVGFHHRYRGVNPPGARVRRDANGNEIILERAPNGLYRARVDVQDANGVWRQKQARSTFFPDDWTPQEVDRAISEAFRNRTHFTDNPARWYGYSNGIRIEGFIPNNGSPRRWNTAFPVIE